jgi:hypothetical protein
MYHSRYHPETSIQTRDIGLYGNELVIPDQTLGPDGWRDSPTHTYLKQGLPPETKINLPTDTNDYDQETVSTILETFRDLARHERVLPIIAWYYAAPLRPYIEEFSGGVGFDHLSVTSAHEDSTKLLLATLCRSFGMSGEPYPVTSFNTLVGALSATNGIPVWLHGYKPNKLTNDQLDDIHRQLERAATIDVILGPDINNQTDIHVHRSPCVISGTQSLQDPTARQWVIETDVEADADKISNRLGELFGDVRPDTESDLPQTVPHPNQHALAYYQFLTPLNTEVVCSAWQWAREQTHHVLSEQISPEQYTTEIASRLGLKGIQTVAFGFEMHTRFVESLDDSSTLLSEDVLNNALRYLVRRKLHM